MVVAWRMDGKVMVKAAVSRPRRGTRTSPARGAMSPMSTGKHPAPGTALDRTAVWPGTSSGSFGPGPPKYKSSPKMKMAKEHPGNQPISYPAWALVEQKSVSSWEQTQTAAKSRARYITRLGPPHPGTDRPPPAARRYISAKLTTKTP